VGSNFTQLQNSCCGTRLRLGILLGFRPDRRSVLAFLFRERTILEFEVIFQSDSLSSTLVQMSSN